MKGFSSEHIILKVDVIGAKDILFAGASVHFQPGNFTGCRAVKELKTHRFVPLPC